MPIIGSPGSEYSRLRMLGFSRLKAMALVFSDPVCFSLIMLWRMCILRPLFMVGVLTVGLWGFLPAMKLAEIANILIWDDNLMSHCLNLLLLSSATLEMMRFVSNWRMNGYPPVFPRASGHEGHGCVERKDKQR